MDIGLSLTLKTHSGAGTGGAPEPEPWYLSGGVALANCVAAYQAKGAADYVTSKVNLADSGTYDLTELPGYSTYNFDALSGWLSNQYFALMTGIGANILGNDGTVICEVADMESVNTSFILWGFSSESDIDGLDVKMYIVPNIAASGNTRLDYYNNNYDGSDYYLNVPEISTGVMAIAGTNCYLDGTKFTGGAINNIWNLSLAANATFGIGCALYYYNGVISDPFTSSVSFKIASIAFYDSTLSDSQIAAITTAMQAL